MCMCEFFDECEATKMCKISFDFTHPKMFQKKSIKILELVGSGHMKET